MLDPICDMVVVVADAQPKGRTVEYDGRTYAFCSNGCVRAFNADPIKWAAKVNAAALQTMTGDAVIDDGMRRWYASCRCCLSDAYPAIVAQLDAERDAAAAH
jgi:YHS domain-containing protein